MMKKNITFILVNFVFLLSCTAFLKFQNPTPNSNSLVDLIEITNNMLLKNIVSEYETTGIRATAFNNIFIVIYDNDPEALDINKISEYVFNAIKNNNCSTSDVKFIIISAIKLNQYSKASPHGMALYMEGSEYQKYLDENDMNGLSTNFTKLDYIREYIHNSNPDLHNLSVALDKASYALSWYADYGSGSREELYDALLEHARKGLQN